MEYFVWYLVFLYILCYISEIWITFWTVRCGRFSTKMEIYGQELIKMENFGQELIKMEIYG